MTYGIRILDKENRVVSIKLRDILSEVADGDQFYWSILFLDCIGNLGKEKSVPLFQKQIRASEIGFSLSWAELIDLEQRFEQIYDIDLIGCLNKDLIKRYGTDEEMYEACDIVIVMFDSCYWEVFTKDKSLIERWEKKFKEVEWLIKNE